MSTALSQECSPDLERARRELGDGMRALASVLPPFTAYQYPERQRPFGHDQSLATITKIRYSTYAPKFHI
jgi:hypothetical protein